MRGPWDQRSRLSVTLRRLASMRLVSSRTASRSSAPRTARSSHFTGLPRMTSASERNLLLCRSTSPTGMMGKISSRCANAPSAMRAAPVRSGSSDGPLWLLPSGNTPTAEPSASACSTAWNISTLRPVWDVSSILR